MRANYFTTNATRKRISEPFAVANGPVEQRDAKTQNWSRRQKRALVARTPQANRATPKRARRVPPQAESRRRKATAAAACVKPPPGLPINVRKEPVQKKANATINRTRKGIFPTWFRTESPFDSLQGESTFLEIVGTAGRSSAAADVATPDSYAATLYRLYTYS